MFLLLPFQSELGWEEEKILRGKIKLCFPVTAHNVFNLVLITVEGGRQAGGRWSGC